MSYNPDIHHRRSIRLRDYDYFSGGAYFVTICTHERACLFGEIVDGEMRLNECGRIVDESWQQILHHFSGVDIDRYVIMPNHFHGIIITVGAGFPHPDSMDARNQVVETWETGGGTPPLRRATLGQVVGYFKYQSTKRINILRNNPGVPVLQRNYYERVIRNEQELAAIRQYIADNPAKWVEDENHPTRV